MNKFFNPQSLVVVGVSGSSFNLGRVVFLNMHHLGFPGKIFGVGKVFDEQFRNNIFPRVDDLPESIECAILLTPAPTVPDLIEACGQKKIGHVVIESAGFSELNEEGSTLANRCKEIAGKHGIRLLGPNCLGIINTYTNLFMPFVKIQALGRPGKISLISQSGGIGSHLFMRLSEEGIGFGKSVSIGNKLDLDEIDFLEYFDNDPDTASIGLYLESINRGRRLFEVARSTGKPIVVLKSNRFPETSNFARSHTAALATDDAIVSAVMHQAGMVRVNTAHEMIVALKAFELPLMKGNRVAILSRSGGHAVITVDACLNYGFTIGPFPEKFYQNLDTVYTSNVVVRQNPLDLIEIFDFPEFASVIEYALQLESIDGVIFNHIYIADLESGPTRTFLTRVKELQKRYDKPVVVSLATEMKEFVQTSRTIEFPLFNEPGDAMFALSRSYEFYKHKQCAQRRSAEAAQNYGQCEQMDRPISPVPSLVSLADSLNFLAAHKVTTAPFQTVNSVSQAKKAARQLGFPLVLKINACHGTHKTDVGGVNLDITNETELVQAYKKMNDIIEAQSVPSSRDGFIVQKMVPAEHELFIGAKRVPEFGPVIMTGAGGIYLEVFRDNSLRLAPVNEIEARHMLEELKYYRILQGIRGRKAVNLDTFARFISIVSKLMILYPLIKEIDLNPVLINEHDTVAVDVRIIT